MQMECKADGSSPEKVCKIPLHLKSLRQKLDQPCPPLKSRKSRKRVGLMTQDKCLSSEEEAESSMSSSLQSQSAAPEDRSKSLLDQSAALHSLIEDYGEYLKTTVRTSTATIENIRRQYEREFSKLNSAVDRLTSLMRNHRDTLANFLISETLLQQHQLSLANREIDAKLKQVQTVSEGVKKVAEVAGKYSEEHKGTTEDQAEFKEAKGRFFELASQFEKVLKHKAKGSVNGRQVLVTQVEVAKMFRANASVIEIPASFSASHIMSMCEKMKEIKRPVLALILPGNTVLKLNMALEKISSEKVAAGPGTSIADCEALSHPNGNSIYLVNGGQISLYDSPNGVLLKKQSNLACTGVTGTASVLLEHYIYVIGGCKDGKAISTVSRYGIITEKWSSVACLHTERYNSSACVVGEDRICVVAGENETSCVLDTIELLDVRNNVWEVCSVVLRTPRKLLNAFSVSEDKVVICGGVGADKEIVAEAEEVDVMAGTSRLLPGMKNPKRNARADSVGNSVLVLGGHGKTADGPIAEKFNSQESKWEPVSCCVDAMLITACPIGLLYE